MDSISAVSNYSIPLTHIVRATYSESRIALPVKTSQLMYAQFKHVTGIPAFSDSQSVSYNKLKQLDMIIDQLSRMKNSSITVNMENTDNTGIDSMFMKYSGELRKQLTTDKPDFYTGIYSPGTILDLTA